jgi:hypothetical protein
MSAEYCCFVNYLKPKIVSSYSIHDGIFGSLSLMLPARLLIWVCPRLPWFPGSLAANPAGMIRYQVLLHCMWRCYRSQET